MHRMIIVVSAIFLPLITLAQDSTVTRRDGFLRVWESIHRPAAPAKTAFSDLPETERGSLEIDYAVARGILDAAAEFYPDTPLTVGDAQLWLIRTRNIEPVDESGAVLFMNIADVAHVPVLAARYGLDTLPAEHLLNSEELETMIAMLDLRLQEEEHEVSLYAEKFHGDGTAFGETFDMHALTAAHRSLPHNTLVRVTNVSNGKSVVVRINDRGPFVQGRNMDLSLAAFTSIEDRSQGKFQATFKRLGDSTILTQEEPSNTDLEVQSSQLLTLSSSCLTLADRFMQRVGRLVLGKGVPHQMVLGAELTLASESAFVVRSIIEPDGNIRRIENWILPGETYIVQPDQEGAYSLRIDSSNGRGRYLTTMVKSCE